MYQCPNCAAGLRFDIATQKLACDHCDSFFDPYEIGRDKDAVEYENFEVKVFSCPECGAELISEDDTVATFCSYCGGTTVLDSRISKEKRPDKIIPFKKTKEDCKSAYARLVKRAIYTPKAFRDPEHLDKFRGIYIPYWNYSFKTDADVDFKALKEYREASYRYTETYHITGHANGEIDDILFDSSSKFYDEMSENIGSFDVSEFQKFTPSYFSGFYADCGDVDSTVYEEFAENRATMFNTSAVVYDKRLSSLTAQTKEKDKVSEQVRPGESKSGIAMLPVWFLSYRTDDNNVAYAVVNGQTGKATGDLPVDKKRYLGISAITALVLFGLFSLFTAKPSTILVFVLIIYVIVFLISRSQMKKLRSKEQLEGDMGLLSLKKQETEAVADNNYKKRKLTANLKFWLTVAVALAVLIISPVEDFIYYGAVVFCIAMVIVSELQLMNRFNILSTRKLPQLGRRGGDENA